MHKPSPSINELIHSASICGTALKAKDIRVHMLTELGLKAEQADRRRALHELETPFEFPVICPRCVKESNLVNADWQMPLSYECAKHDVVLIDSCPHCDTRLSWSGNLYRAVCDNPNCMKRLVPTPAIDDIIKLTKTQRLDCIKTALAVESATPYYFIEPKLSTLNNLGRYIERGLLYLTDDNAFSSWVEKLDGLGTLPTMFRFAKVYQLKQSMKSEWPVFERLDLSGDTRSNYTEATPALINLEMPRYLFQITAGLDNVTIDYLRGCGGITFQGNTRLSASSVINVAPLFNHLLKQSKYIANPVTLSQFEQRYPGVLHDFTEVWLAIWAKDLAWHYHRGDTLVNSIGFDEDELKRFCFERLDYKLKWHQTLRIAEAANFLNLSRRQLMTYVADLGLTVLVQDGYQALYVEELRQIQRIRQGQSRYQQSMMFDITPLRNE